MIASGGIHAAVFPCCVFMPQILSLRDLTQLVVSSVESLFFCFLSGTNKLFSPCHHHQQPCYLRSKFMPKISLFFFSFFLNKRTKNEKSDRFFCCNILIAWKLVTANALIKYWLHVQHPPESFQVGDYSVWDNKSQILPH